MLRHGQLPFWNQYIFSGTPLLAGFNAGAFYPLIGSLRDPARPGRLDRHRGDPLLAHRRRDVRVPPRPEALDGRLRSWPPSPSPSPGVVLSQVNHVDMTEGFASIPFMLLAVLHIVRDGRWRWSMLLGIGFALVIFGGAPEAMLDEALLVVAYAARLGRTRSRPLVAGR